MPESFAEYNEMEYQEEAVWNLKNVKPRTIWNTKNLFEISTAVSNEKVMVLVQLLRHINANCTNTVTFCCLA